MTASVAPAPSAWENSCASSSASGVVCGAGRILPATWYSTVPTSALLRPAACRMDSIRKLVVVLPLVPVMPVIRSFSAGRR